MHQTIPHAHPHVRRHSHTKTLPKTPPHPLNTPSQPQVWTDVFGCLLRLLRPHVLEQAGDTPPTSTPTDTRTSVQTMQRIVYSSTAMERVIDALLSLYTDHAPWQVKASVFAAVVQGLGRCMATRYTVYPADLWRKATGAFCAVVTAGLPSVNVAFAEVCFGWVSLWVYFWWGGCILWGGCFLVVFWGRVFSLGGCVCGIEKGALMCVTPCVL